ncbi:MAG TPA: universal stress protein [Acidimicrobiales bacterium]|nr:universal stress protein [Acidimicrobiales bacterium]
MAGRILVGVDGSSGSRRALRWATEEAARRGAHLDAVLVWRGPYEFGRAIYAIPVHDKAVAEAARERLVETVSAVTGADAAVKVNPIVLEGDPAEALCALSAEADLLVVGSRGHGGFTGLVLGSVSEKCAHHSRCPVVIVPKNDGVTSDEG